MGELLNPETDKRLVPVKGVGRVGVGGLNLPLPHWFGNASAFVNDIR